MSEITKNYISGLFIIGIVVQPWYVAKLIGINMDSGFMSYTWGIIIELAVGFLIYLPYWIGKTITGPRL